MLCLQKIKFLLDITSNNSKRRNISFHFFSKNETNLKTNEKTIKFQSILL